MDSTVIQAVIVWAALAAAVARVFVRLRAPRENQSQIEIEIATPVPAEEAGWADSAAG